MSDADRYHAVSALQADLKAAEARAERAEAQLARQNETNRRLHTRCQIAEKAARDNVDACMRKGVSLSRGLSHFAYLKAEERAKESQTEIARLQMQVDAMCDAEELRQEREARKQAEAEVARLTHDLSVATNWVEHHSQHASDLIGELARLREPNCTLVGFDATDRTLTVKMDGPIMDCGWWLGQRAALAGEGGK
jgi:multidrug resistance efflux pump